jgi:D-alanyl-D-alanine carboxypeptidase
MLSYSLTRALATAFKAVLIASCLPAAAFAGPDIRSGAALVIDHDGTRVFSRNATEVRSIASITKLMTAMVVLDADVPLDDRITITEQDRDRLRWSRSRLRIGEATLSRRDMLQVALMSSDNRAAAALGRTTFAEGTPRFVEAMNERAASLGMLDSRFADASGLDAGNRSTAEDLVRLIHAASQYPLIREITSTGEFTAHPYETRGSAVPQHEPAGAGLALDRRAEQDRLHPRGRALPRHAGGRRRASTVHRPAERAGQVDAGR